MTHPSIPAEAAPQPARSSAPGRHRDRTRRADDPIPIDDVERRVLRACKTIRCVLVLCVVVLLRRRSTVRRSLQRRSFSWQPRVALRGGVFG